MTSPASPSHQSAMAAALSLLARRRHTRQELARKLAAGKCDRCAIAVVLAECERLGYLDDEAAAVFYVEELMRRRLGPYRIQQRMRERGFCDAHIQQALARRNYWAEEAFLAAAALEKKWPAICRDPDPARRRAKALRFLVSRGFRAEAARAAAERIAAASPGERPNKS